MKLAVVGVGLLGGSIGLAARARAGASVSGYDTDARTLAGALELGALDRACESVAEAVAGAEVAFVAVPVGAMRETVAAALAAAGPDCVVSDVGSTKRELSAAIADGRFVGGHPMAGAETAGIEHARADLFDGAPWYVTPTSDTLPAALARLREAISALGAEVWPIDAAAHDRLMASVSHLPHVFANVLVEGAAAALARERDALGAGETTLAGPSFRDATRVAGANTAIWADIYLANRDALAAAIDEAVARLGEVRDGLLRADRDALAAWNERARANRGLVG